MATYKGGCVGSCSRDYREMVEWVILKKTLFPVITTHWSDMFVIH